MMDEMKNTLENLIKQALESVGAPETKFTVEHPINLAFGDYTTNAGIVSKKGDSLLQYIVANLPDGVEKVEIKSGFINFYLSKEFFKKSVGEIIEAGDEYGKNKRLNGEKIIVEHTDANPFKLLHIGHLMPLTIGSTLAHLFGWNGAESKQSCYQGDVGMHVAKAVWALKNGSELNEAYAVGNRAFEEDENAKQEISEINKKLYTRSDEEINKTYDVGRKASLDSFEEVYKKLGLKFDYSFFESEVAETGKQIVLENKGNVFEESEGAIVFHGEKYDPSLHTRVFINSEGLPVYEAKDLGLAKVKFETYPCDQSIIVTANEQSGYFKVLLKALELVLPELAQKTKHIAHGTLRLPTGKMSSRTGDVITAESLIDTVKEKVKGDEAVAIGAIKYMILRQSIGNDIIFDLEKSVSTEGDSGVYLQYAHARTNSLLEKAKEEKMKGDANGERKETHEIEKLLYRFPEIVERAGVDYSPNIIVTYLTELAGSFNNFYAHEQIISDDAESPYRIAVVEAFRTVMKNGLNILGIPAPERM